MREGKHFWEQVILVEVLEMIDLVDLLKVFVGNVLNLVENLLILYKACPEHAVVILVAIVLRWVIHDIVVDTIVLKRNRRAALEKLRRNLRSHFVLRENVEANLRAELLVDLLLLMLIELRHVQ